MADLRTALAPIRDRMPYAASERDVLRVVARLRRREDIEAARRIVLDWAEEQAGRRLPPQARDGEPFDDPLGGRNVGGERVAAGAIDLWSLRVENTDNAGRTWTSEVTVGGAADDPGPVFSMRLMLSGDAGAEFMPATPRFMRRVAEEVGLAWDGHPLHAFEEFGDSDDPTPFFDLLEQENRRLPAFVVTPLQGGQAPIPGDLDPLNLGRAALGLGHVVFASPKTSWALTDRYGQKLSVFGGAVRIYEPGFDAFADPYAHRLFLVRSPAEPRARTKGAALLREHAAAASIRRNPLGGDVLSFHEVRAARLKLQSRAQEVEGRSDADQLATAQAQITELETRVREALAELSYFDEEHKAAERRAQEAEHQLRTRIEWLEGRLTRQGSTEGGAESEPWPGSWEEFTGWAARSLAGRLVLTSAARRGCKKPLFASPQVAARCLRWLPHEARDSFSSRSELPLKQAAIEDGIQNAPCGGDAFEFDHLGRRPSAEWHIKNGGNTRDPARCLRIYYAFDEGTQEIVVADMPAHRRTAAT